VLCVRVSMTLAGVQVLHQSADGFVVGAGGAQARRGDCVYIFGRTTLRASGPVIHEPECITKQKSIRASVPEARVLSLGSCFLPGNADLPIVLVGAT
jgi:hypothetical protein